MIFNMTLSYEEFDETINSQIGIFSKNSSSSLKRVKSGKQNE
jgi:hypothetical protein